MANTWNQTGTTWGQNSYGLQTEVLVSLTGLSITSTVGSVESFNETGWGSDTWGAENWGESAIDVILPSLTATTSLNIPSEFIEVQPGWGTLDWGENGWGTVNSAVFNLSGLSATTSVGSLSPDDQIMGLTGLSAQTAAGSLSTKSDVSLILSGLSLQSSPGLLSVDDHSVGLPGLSATSAVGSISPADVIGITGLSAQTAVGAITISSNPILDIVAVKHSKGF